MLLFLTPPIKKLQASIGLLSLVFRSTITNKYNKDKKALLNNHGGSVSRVEVNFYFLNINCLENVKSWSELKSFYFIVKKTYCKQSQSLNNVEY